jgi:hypothetical protein
MVRRERYRAVLVWGKHEKTYKGGTKVRVPRSKEEWVTIEVPELRVVDNELWVAVQKRWSKREEFTASRRRGGHVPYFLSGFGRCAKCNGPKLPPVRRQPALRRPASAAAGPPHVRTHVSLRSGVASRKAALVAGGAARQRARLPPRPAPGRAR